MIRVTSYPVGYLQATCAPDPVVINDTLDDRSHCPDTVFVGLQKGMKKQRGISASLDGVVQQSEHTLSKRVWIEWVSRIALQFP